jgi:hypothetical protein
MTMVQIEKPEDADLADWFAELRSWFDVHNCNPSLFAKAGQIMNRDRFNIKFSNNADAQLFATSFAKYSPSIPRPVGEEPTSVEDCLDVTDQSVEFSSSETIK